MTSCIIVVGKPGAGKSSIGKLLSHHLNGSYYSVGGFIRSELGIPDPHIEVDKEMVFKKLHTHLLNKQDGKVAVIDCHPYPEDYLKALNRFLKQPNMDLQQVVYVTADDEVALKRLNQRPRPGQTYEERLKYFADNVHFIEQLIALTPSYVAENNRDFDDLEQLNNVAQDIIRSIEENRKI